MNIGKIREKDNWRLVERCPLTHRLAGSMGRKERCPQCRSGKITVSADSKKCNVCGYEWTERVRRKDSRRDKVRF